MDIEKERLESNDPGLDEEEEFHTLNLINSQDAKLPRLDLLIDRNKEKADKTQWGRKSRRCRLS